MLRNLHLNRFRGTILSSSRKISSLFSAGAIHSGKVESFEFSSVRRFESLANAAISQSSRRSVF